MNLYLPLVPSLAFVHYASSGWFRLWLPLPLFLLWPLGLLVLGGVWIAESIHQPGRDRAGRPRRRHGATHALLAAYCAVRDLKISVDTADGNRVRIWFL